MTRLRLNHSLLLLLITAFLTMQWTTGHFHLAGNHDHDGSHHHHKLELHTYQAGNHHADAIDAVHQSSDLNQHLNIVESDHKFGLIKNEQYPKQSAAAIVPAFPQLTLSQLTGTAPPNIVHTKRGRLHRSAANPRAPPLLADNSQQKTG